MKKILLFICLFVKMSIITAQSAAVSISNITIVGNKVTFNLSLTATGTIYLGNFDITVSFATSKNILTTPAGSEPLRTFRSSIAATSAGFNVPISTSISAVGTSSVKINYTPSAPGNQQDFDEQIAVIPNPTTPTATTVSLGSYSVNFDSPFSSVSAGTLTCGGVTLFSLANNASLMPPFPGTAISTTCTGSASLPLELLAFTAATNAKSNKTTAQLSWLTAREVNLQGYEVERSGDGKTYEKIGSVKPTGSASSTEKYAFTDDVPLSGTNYYRLKMVNTEGSFTYSAVRSVLVSDGKTDKVSVSPNPAKDRVVVKLNALEAKNVTLTLVDVAGKTVLTDNKSLEAGFNEFSLNLTQLPQGLYFLKVADGKTSEMHRLVIGN
jgi:hypothetical protein